MFQFIIDSPTEPPPPPPPDSKWEDTESEVVHLGDETFKNTLKKRKHALVMFYAPCKFSLLNVFVTNLNDLLALSIYWYLLVLNSILFMKLYYVCTINSNIGIVIP